MHLARANRDLPVLVPQTQTNYLPHLPGSANVHLASDGLEGSGHINK